MKSGNEEFQKFLDENPDLQFLVADGFDEAIVGHDLSKKRLIYDSDICISILEERDGMTNEDAIEYFMFNVDGAYVGEQTPIFL